MKKARLLKLATHLESGKLGVDRWDFGVLYERKSCGTVGCAMGECLTVFPRAFKYDDINGFIRLQGTPIGDAIYMAEVWFGITEDQAEYLFIPHDADWPNYLLPASASPVQVAQRIRQFVKQGGILRE